MRKLLSILFFVFLLSIYSYCYAEDEIPTLKQDQKKELKFSVYEGLNLLPDNKDSFVDRIQNNINLFSDKIKEKFSIWLSRSTKYIEKMKK